MSSTSSKEAAYLSGLGVGCVDCERGTLLKKEVIGLYICLAGAFLVRDVLVVVGLDCLGETARAWAWAWDRVALSVTRGPVEVAVSVPRRPVLERSGGGESDSRPSDSSDEKTSGFFRGARNLAMGAQGGGSEAVSAAQ